MDRFSGYDDSAGGSRSGLPESLRWIDAPSGARGDGRPDGDARRYASRRPAQRAAALPEDPIDFGLLNYWQRDFPLIARPFDAIAGVLGTTTDDVLDRYARLLSEGVVSRIGGVVGSGVGAGLLCAMQVPPSEIEAVAAIVDREPSVNHDYEREHAWNLWFVVTAADAAAVHAIVDRLQAQLQRRIMRLPMLRAYRIDLGFDLAQDAVAGPQPYTARRSPARLQVPDSLRPLAAAVEQGLPLIDIPYAWLADEVRLSEDRVRRTIARWLRVGVLRRFGVVVRHHELGIRANAMLVLDLPDRDASRIGQRLAGQPGVTLCYRRARAPGWPYNVYCMFHGREREAVRARIDAALADCALEHVPHEVLFSVRRFKQTGSRYFADAATGVAQ